MSGRRNRFRRPVSAALLAALTLSGPGLAAAGESPLHEILARYEAARGGEAWAAARTLVVTGGYAAFSQQGDFTLLRQRGAEHDLYRLDFTLLGEPAIRARGPQAAWWQHPLIQAEPARLVEGPYRSLMERESVFGPALLEARRRGIEVSLLGAGDVDGVETVDLGLHFPDGSEEVWHLDASTMLEVAVDSEVTDWTQGPDPMAQRTFFDDFREVGGLVLPFHVEVEFGARLEVMDLASVEVDGEIDARSFTAPPPVPPAAETEGEIAPAADDSESD